MKVYKVGGCVRDEILKRESNDIDYVVVGSNPEEMIAKGFKSVGKSFPVFLHPETKDEYALARKEKTTGKSTQDFSFETVAVSLEEDLKRRDLTINAIAKMDDGTLVDPFNGLSDIKNKVIRHVSDAFSEDPLRVLRAARFASQLDFTVAPETISEMKSIVNSKMLETLPRERVTKELIKVCKSPRPSAFIKVLDEVGALEILFPSLYRLKGQTQPAEYHPEGDSFAHLIKCLDDCKDQHYLVVLGIMFHDIGKGVTAKDKLPAHHGHDKSGVKVFETETALSLSLTSKEAAFCKKVIALHIKARAAFNFRAGKLIKFLKNFKKREDLVLFIDCCVIDHFDGSFHEGDYILDSWDFMKTLKVGEFINTLKSRKFLEEKILQFKVKSLKKFITDNKSKYLDPD